MQITFKNKIFKEINSFEEFLNELNKNQKYKIKPFKNLEIFFNITKKISKTNFNYKYIQKQIFGKSIQSIYKKEYWIQRGYSIDEAKEIIKEIQTKNNKKLFEKYSKEELKKFSIKNKLSEEEYKEYTKKRTENAYKAKINKYIELGYTEKEAIELVKKDNLKNLELARKTPKLSPTQKEYWLKKGYTEFEAMELIKERQATFSLEKCIEKYGFIEGHSIWKNRNIKWHEKYKETCLKKYGVPYFILSNQFNPDYKITKPHQEIIDFIKDNYNGEILINTRNIIRPYELDIYIPEFNFAIEIDGIYFHSFKKGDKINKNIHKLKCDLCNEKNIHLFRILDIEWNDKVKKDIWKSKILYKLKLLKNRIYARNCIIKEIDSKISKKFLNENHLQGYVNSSIKYGLFYNNELVSVMTFGKSRFKNEEYELLRFSNKKYYNIVGGFSKLLKHFLNKYNFEIITYGNRRWVDSNNVYNKFFKKEYITKPNFYYIIKNKMYHRMTFQKHKIKNLPDYNENLSSIDNMLNFGAYIYYDCGNIKYKLTNN